MLQDDWSHVGGLVAYTNSATRLPVVTGQSVGHAASAFGGN